MCDYKVRVCPTEVRRLLCVLNLGREIVADKSHVSNLVLDNEFHVVSKISGEKRKKRKPYLCVQYYK